MYRKGTPGSKEAKTNGCTCPVLDNEYGLGIHKNGEKYGYIIEINCTIHSITAINDSLIEINKEN